MRVREGRDHALQQAIKKYGADNFKVETLVIADNWQYLCDLECKAIAAFNTRSPYGYNLTRGGEGVVGRPITDETRVRMSAAQKKRFARPIEAEKQRERAKINGEKRRKPLGHKAPWELRLKASTLKARLGEDGAKIEASKRTRAAMARPDVRAKVLYYAKQRASSKEWRKKVGDAKRGHLHGPRSPEAIARQVAGIKAAWADPVKKAARIEKNRLTRRMEK